jgi:hypothetical protein
MQKTGCGRLLEKLTLKLASQKMHFVGRYLAGHVLKKDWAESEKVALQKRIANR